MKKGRISVEAGLILGLVISYFVLQYDGWTLVSIGRNGKTTSTVNELDVDLLTNAFGIILVSIAAIYSLLTLIGKNKKERS